MRMRGNWDRCKKRELHLYKDVVDDSDIE